MGNKEKVNALMHELQGCINQAYVWQEMGDDEEVTMVCDRITQIRQEVLDIVID